MHLTFGYSNLLYIQVLSSYREDEFSFLMKVFNVPSYLEDLTGLTQLLQDARVSEVSQ